MAVIIILLFFNWLYLTFIICLIKIIIAYIQNILAFKLFPEIGTSIS